MRQLVLPYANYSIDLLGNIYANLLGLKKISGKDKKNRNLSVLLLPPTDSGSLGDQAMVTAVINHFQEQGAKVGLLAYNSIFECQEFYPKVEVIKYHNSLQFAKLVSQYDKFCCLGADVMDGYYSQKRSLLRAKLVSIAAKTGADSSILGFSFNSDPNPKAIKALERLPQNVRLFARDPVSHQRLLENLTRPVELTADLAFLLSPNDDSEVSCITSQWIDREQVEGRIVIGINANCKLLESLEVKTAESLCKIYVDNLVKIYKDKPVSFVVIPHDFREAEGAISDIAFAEMIWNFLPSEIQYHCLKVPTPCTAGDIKSICGKLDLVVTGRMHLAIASLGQGTPAACITYQGKFEGLFKHFGLDGMTINPEQAIKTESIFNFVMPLIENRKEIRRQISSKLPYIQQMAKANLNSPNIHY
jgi:polysaccharide pyruvyl transferase WcaK-like protein